MRRALLLGGLLILLCCSLGASAAAHRYTVSTDEQLTELSVHACLAGAPKSLRARSKQAEQLLIDVHNDSNGETIKLTQGRIPLNRPDSCVRYRVDLVSAAALNSRYQHIADNNRLIAIPHWLWLPRGQGATKTEIRFELPPRMSASVPWRSYTEADGSGYYQLEASPRSDNAVLALGYFKSCDIKVPGARLRTAFVRGRFKSDEEALGRWLTDAAHNVALTYGRFPNPAPQILVVPVAKHLLDNTEPVPFGHVIRDGGEAVQFYVNQRQPGADFIADWTATHEFAHLLIPYVSSDEKWISEGLASYYQNVLMARGGNYSAEKAWRKIIEGFRRGEQSVPHLSLESAMPIGSWDGIMKTYWGGAAIFLMADVELRRRSNGEASLDTVLSELQQCCLPSARMWDGLSLFRKLDRLAPSPVFESLYERYRAQKEFPAYDALLRKLGVSLNLKRVSFNNDAPWASIRNNIMRTPVTRQAHQLEMTCRS